MIRSLVTICYNGKIDNDTDSARLISLVNNVLVAETFDDGFDIVAAVSMHKEETGADAGSAKGHSLVLPATASWTAFEDWVNKLPEREPPSYLGLPENAEKLLLVEHGKDMVRNVGKVMRILDESEQVMAEAEGVAD